MSIISVQCMPALLTLRCYQHVLRGYTNTHDTLWLQLHFLVFVYLTLILLETLLVYKNGLEPFSLKLSDQRNQPALFITVTTKIALPYFDLLLSQTYESIFTIVIPYRSLVKIQCLSFSRQSYKCTLALRASQHKSYYTSVDRWLPLACHAIHPGGGGSRD